MLDYAANCLTCWSVETLQSSLERTCQEAGKLVDSVIRELIGEDDKVDEFWQRVKTNLQAKRIRLLFVADVIPLELRRIVEFLNEQMDPAEVLAIELRQFASKGLKTIVPTVYGQTQEAARKHAGGGQHWDEVSFFEKLEKTVKSPELRIAREIFDWMRRGGKRELIWGTGKENGSVYPTFKPGGVSINPVYLSSDGRLYLQFGSLQNKPVFGALERRQELLERFNAISGVHFEQSDLTKYKNIPLSVIAADQEGGHKAIAALKWMEEQIDRRELSAKTYRR
jgi:hypothetical protein